MQSIPRYERTCVDGDQWTRVMPAELTAVFFTYLELNDILNIFLTCTSWHAIASDNLVGNKFLIARNIKISSQKPATWLKMLKRWFYSPYHYVAVDYSNSMGNFMEADHETTLLDLAKARLIKRVEQIHKTPHRGITTIGFSDSYHLAKISNPEEVQDFFKDVGKHLTYSGTNVKKIMKKICKLHVSGNGNRNAPSNSSFSIFSDIEFPLSDLTTPLDRFVGSRNHKRIKIKLFQFGNSRESTAMEKEIELASLNKRNKKRKFRIFFAEKNGEKCTEERKRKRRKMSSKT